MLRPLVFSLIFACGCASTATLDRARAHARQGIALQDDGRWQESLAELERAEALHAAPTHELYIARAEAGLGRMLEACATYRRLVGTELAADAPPPFFQARTFAAAELAALEQRVPRLRVEVQPSAVPGLQVRLDGATLPASWLGVERAVDPGEHVVVVRADGYGETESRVRIAVGERKPLIVLLRRDPAAPQRATSGSVSVAKAP